MDRMETIKLLDKGTVIRLLQTLRDFTPELSEVSDEELYKYWVWWMLWWNKWELKDYILNSYQGN